MGSEAKGKRVKLKRGDLFEFSASDSRLGYGVVVSPGGVLEAIFLPTLHVSQPPLEVLARDQPALIGSTMDALFFHRRWVVVGHDFPLANDLPFPNWKVRMNGELYAADFEGRTLWPIQAEEVELLDFKSSASPITYQHAVEAMNGLRAWEDYYDALTFDYAKRRVTRDRDGRYIARR